MTDKQILRAQALAARRALPSERFMQAAQLVREQLLQIIPANASTIGGYLSINGELDVSASLSALSSRGHGLALPVIKASDAPLLFREWQPGDALEKGAYNIDIPLETAKAVLPDVVLVPLVAFDGKGHRLGYGAGYYDRTLAELRASGKKILAIGVGFAAQRVEEIPADPHDEKLDAIVTEIESLML